jgi:hypothetical protein
MQNARHQLRTERLRRISRHLEKLEEEEAQVAEESIRRDTAVHALRSKLSRKSKRRLSLAFNDEELPPVDSSKSCQISPSTRYLLTLSTWLHANKRDPAAKVRLQLRLRDVVLSYFNLELLAQAQGSHPCTSRGCSRRQ